MLTCEILSKYNARELMMPYKSAKMALCKANKVGNGNDKTRAAKRVRLHEEFMRENNIKF